MELNKIYNEDCLEGMKRIPDGSIDAIICDLPYGTTACAWDTIIPFDKLWEQYERIIKNNGAIVLFSQQPFTATLITSNIKLFRYEWIWEKQHATGWLNANKLPLKCHENICVFYKQLPTYNPQMGIGEKYVKKGLRTQNSQRFITIINLTMKQKVKENVFQEILSISSATPKLIIPQ